MVRPDQEAEDRDRNGRKSDETITEDALAREAGNNFGYNAHRRQNHDVDGRMRIEPEQMLEQERIAAEFGIEDAEMQHAFGSNHHDGDGEDRRAQ